MIIFTVEKENNQKFSLRFHKNDSSCRRRGHLSFLHSIYKKREREKNVRNIFKIKFVVVH